MSVKVFSPAPHREPLPADRVDPEYEKLRIPVF